MISSAHMRAKRNAEHMKICCQGFNFFQSEKLKSLMKPFKIHPNVSDDPRNPTRLNRNLNQINEVIFLILFGFFY